MITGKDIEVIAAIRGNSKISQQGIADAMGTSRQNVHVIVSRMIDNKLLSRQGTWLVINENKVKKIIDRINKP